MKDIKHLIRAFTLAILAVIIFTVVRNLVVPKSFGKYGHYRADAVAEEMAKQPLYQGADVYKKCYGDIYDKWADGKHKVVNCENCHEPGNIPITSPKSQWGTKTITINREQSLCLRCHLSLPARPGTLSAIPQPQVNLEEHMKGKGKIACFKCHNPHYPDLKREEEVEEKVANPVEKKVVSEVSRIVRKVYQDTCLVCHGKDGKGKTETSEFLDPNPPDFSADSFKKLITFLAAIGIPDACVLHGYVGFIFGSVVANPWWSTHLMPFIFLLSAMVSGIAMMIILYVITIKLTGVPVCLICFRRLAVILWGFLNH